MKNVIFFSLALIAELIVLILSVAHGIFDWFSVLLILLVIGNIFAVYIHLPAKK